MSCGMVLTAIEVNGRVFVHSSRASLEDYRQLSTVTEESGRKFFRFAGCCGRGSSVVEMECPLLAGAAEHGFNRFGGH